MAVALSCRSMQPEFLSSKLRFARTQLFCLSGVWIRIFVTSKITESIMNLERAFSTKCSSLSQTPLTLISEHTWCCCACGCTATLPFSSSSLSCNLLIHRKQEEKRAKTKSLKNCKAFNHQCSWNLHSVWNSRNICLNFFKTTWQVLIASVYLAGRTMSAEFTKQFPYDQPASFAASSMWAKPRFTCLTGGHISKTSLFKVRNGRACANWPHQSLCRPAATVRNVTLQQMPWPSAQSKHCVLHKAPFSKTKT